MLLEIGIGDAYGRPFEFNTPEFITKNNDIIGYKHRDNEVILDGIGRYTDDTQMSLAIAEHMISEFPGTQIRYAHHFVNAYHRDPRNGYSKRIKKALSESRVNFPFELIIKANPTGFSSNGSVMRTIPLGLRSNPKEIIYNCIVHTSVTHGSIEATNATIAIALTAHYLYHIIETVKGDLYTHYASWMKAQMGHEFFEILDSYKEEDGTLQCDAKSTAALSIKLAFGFKGIKSASDLLKLAIDIGGDVDSSAAIGLGLYSLRPDANMNLPKALYDNLENDKYGRDYLIEIDKNLFKQFPKIV